MLTILEEKHPLAAQFIKFYAFSVLVTLLQYLLLTFLPGIFHSATNWCDIPCQLIHLKLGPVDTYVSTIRSPETPPAAWDISPPLLSLCLLPNV